MAAVVEFVSNVVEDVVDAVGDAVEAVGDFVEDTVEFIGDTVQAVIEDPIPVLAQIAGSFIGIPPPVTAAMVTAARGGDIEDIVLSAGTAYLAPQATNAISTTLSSTIGNSIINETVSDIVVDGVSRGLVNGTIAEVRGGDFEDGFAGAFTGSVINSSVGEFTNEFIKPGIQEMLADSGIEPATVNTLVREGTRAVSAGLGAELTGRGDFDTAFVNSIQNSTINVGTNYAVNTIGDQFRTAENGLASQTFPIKGDSEREEEILALEDYFQLETSRDSDTTAAGIPDDLVEQVATSDAGTDSGTATQTLASQTFPTQELGAASNVDTLLASADASDLISEFGGEGTETAEGAIAEEDVPEDVRDLYADYGVGEEIEAPSMPVMAEGVPELEVQPAPIGGLTAARQTEVPADLTEEDIVFSGGKASVDAPESITDAVGTPVQVAAKPYDPYEGLDQAMMNAPTEESAVDITGKKQEGVLPGGLNAVQQLAGKLVPDVSFDKNKMITGALNQFVRPAIQQGLTRAIKGTPTKPVMRRPAPKRPMPAQQQTQMARAPAPVQRAPQTIDMTKVRQVAKAPPPKKVDVKTLTPITNVAGLTSILNRGKG